MRALRARIPIGCLLLALACCGLHALAQDRQQATELIVNDIPWPPYYFGGQAGEPPGFGKEVLQRCIPRAGYRYRFVPVPIQRMYGELQSGELDLHVMSRREDREAYLLFGSEPVFYSGYRPIVRADDHSEIRSLEDIDALRLGHVLGFRYSDWFLEYVEQRKRLGDIESVTTEESALKMLLAGRIDVYVANPNGSVWLARELGLGDKIQVLDYDIRTRPYFVAVSRQSSRIRDPAALLSRLDACLRELKRDGAYEELAERYGAAWAPQAD